MKKFIALSASAALFSAGNAVAQNQDASEQAQEVVPSAPVQTSAATAPTSASPTSITLPKDTLLRVSPVSEITSKKMKEGQTREFRIAEEVRRDGVTIVPLNAPVVAAVTWRTGKGIFGKSAKFELTFTSVEINGQTYELSGKHRQEGRGNTAAALLVSGIITGKSAVMLTDQVVNARTAQDITVTTS